MKDTFELPETGFVRLAQILRVIPVSKSFWWQEVAAGRLPQPIKFGRRLTLWRAEEIHALIKQIAEEGRR